MYSKKPQLAIWGLSISRAPLHAYDPPCMGSAGGRRLIHEVRFAQDSPPEGTGFEPSVPRDTTEVSRAAHIASA
jgi:hypothetical protein